MTTAALHRRAGALRVLFTLRIAVTVAILNLFRTDPPWEYGHLPDSARTGSLLGGEIIAWLPTSGAVIGAAALVMTGALVLMCTGWRVRLTASLAAVIGIQVLESPTSPPH